MLRHRLSRLGWSTLTACLLTCTVIGCGSGGLVPVSGKVMLDGERLEAGSVAFHPDNSKGNTSLHLPAGIVTDGTYVIYTNGKKGAAPGAYKVTVTADNFSGKEVPAKGATAEMPKSLLAEKFGSKATTPLAVEVSANSAKGSYDLVVSKK